MLKAKRLAIEHFEATGELPKDRGKHEYILHHKDPNLKHTDPDRYYEYRWDDLEVVTYKGHSDMHGDWNKGMHKYTDGIHNTYANECPPGFKSG